MAGQGASTRRLHAAPVMRRLIPLALAALLAACATASEPKIEVREVKVAVPVRCDPQPRPQKPVLPDHTTAPDIFDGVKRLLVRDKLHTAYEGELEAALSGCTGDPPPAP